MKGVTIGKLINESFLTVEKSWDKIVSAIILMFATIFGLMLFPLFGFFLSFFSFGFLCLGQKKFMLDLCEGKRVQAETVFSYYKFSLKGFALKVLICFFSMLWGLLFIIPGIISLLNHSFASFLMCENINLDTFEALTASKSLTYGYRTKILLIYLFALLLMLAFALFGFCVVYIIDFFTFVPTFVYYISAVIPFIISGFLLAFPIAEVALTKIYLEARPEKKVVSKTKKTTVSPRKKVEIK